MNPGTRRIVRGGGMPRRLLHRLDKGVPVCYVITGKRFNSTLFMRSSDPGAPSERKSAGAGAKVRVVKIGSSPSAPETHNTHRQNGGERRNMMKRMKIGARGNSFARKVLVRLLGEEKGAVMMEYVIVAVLIAAACVVAVAMFGKTIVGMFDTAAKGATGDHSGAKQSLDSTQQTQSSDAQKASEYHDSMHK